MNRILTCFELMTLLGVVSTQGQGPKTLTKEQWRQDGQQLAQLLREEHVDLFATIPEKAFDEAVDRFLRGVEGWNDERIRVELFRLIALPSQGGRNGHTLIWPLQSATAFSVLELKLYAFEEGLFVVDAGEANRDLIGARLLRIDDSTADQLKDSVAPLVHRDGPAGLRRFETLFILIPNVLRALGHTSSVDAVELTLETASGAVTSRRVASISPKEYRQLFGTFTLLPAADQRPFWAKTLEDGIIYAKYNLVERRGPGGEKLSGFVNALQRLAREQPTAPIVVDLRENGGGNNGTYQPLLKFLIDSRANAENRLFALIGRGTFSAAGNFVTDLEKGSNVILVGEGTGGAPNQYGDSKFHKLEHSGIEVAIPTVYWEKGGPADDRLTHSPTIAAPPRAEEYFAGIDGAMAAVRRRVGE